MNENAILHFQLSPISVRQGGNLFFKSIPQCVRKNGTGKIWSPDSFILIGGKAKGLVVKQALYYLDTSKFL